MLKIEISQVNSAYHPVLDIELHFTFHQETYT